MSQITVILPCAGKGTRLGLPYPKEMMQLEKGKSIIDYSFDFFANESEIIHFVIILNPHKMQLASYLYKYVVGSTKNDPLVPKFRLSFIFQDPKLHDLAGAIKSARHLFSDLNIVLLPDSIMTLKNKDDSLVKLLKQGVKEKGFSFMYVKEDKPKRLKQQGCLRVEGNLVMDYEDKPDDPSRFNAYWTAYAFEQYAFDSCIEVIEKSTARDSYNLYDSLIYKSTAVEVEAFVDVGTWDSVHQRLAYNYLSDAGIDPLKFFGEVMLNPIDTTPFIIEKK